MRPLFYNYTGTKVNISVKTRDDKLNKNLCNGSSWSCDVDHHELDVKISSDDEPFMVDGRFKIETTEKNPTFILSIDKNAGGSDILDLRDGQGNMYYGVCKNGTMNFLHRLPKDDWKKINKNSDGNIFTLVSRAKGLSRRDMQEGIPCTGSAAKWVSFGFFMLLIVLLFLAVSATVIILIAKNRKM